MGKIPILTNIFQLGWNHQLVDNCPAPRSKEASLKDQPLLLLGSLESEVSQGFFGGWNHWGVLLGGSELKFPVKILDFWTLMSILWNIEIHTFRKLYLGHIKQKPTWNEFTKTNRWWFRTSVNQLKTGSLPYYFYSVFMHPTGGAEFLNHQQSVTLKFAASPGWWYSFTGGLVGLVLNTTAGYQVIQKTDPQKTHLSSPKDPSFFAWKKNNGIF